MLLILRTLEFRFPTWQQSTIETCYMRSGTDIFVAMNNGSTDNLNYT